MGEGLDGRPSSMGGRARLDLGELLPWLMGAWMAVVVAVNWGFAEQLRHAPPAAIGALLATSVLLWLGIAVAAVVQAIRHARVSRGLARVAWWCVPTLFLVGLPFMLSFASDHHESEDSDATCIPGLVPDTFVEATFGWISSDVPAYVALWTYIALAVAGLAFLVPASTRAPGARILLGVLMGFAMVFGTAITIVNQCD